MDSGHFEQQSNCLLDIGSNELRKEGEMEGTRNRIARRASQFVSVILSIALVCGVPTEAFSDELSSSSSNDGEELIARAPGMGVV